MTSASHATPSIQVGVCIDDVGLHLGVTEAAPVLFEAGRVSALSCMSEAPSWRDAAAMLVPALRGKVDFGLHLTFTEPWSGSRLRRPLRALVAAAFAHALDRDAVRVEIRRQLDAFEDTLGDAPDFVDGHQHVHQLPVIREVLVEELSTRYALRKPWIRHTGVPQRARWSAPPSRDELKERVIAALGAGPLQSLARDAGFQQNGHLLGVYGFNGSPADYLARWGRWCAQAADGDLLMCHPAAHDTGADDPIASARTVEYRVLCDERIDLILAESGVSVIRLSRHGAADLYSGAN